MTSLTSGMLGAAFSFTLMSAFGMGTWASAVGCLIGSGIVVVVGLVIDRVTR